jgi:hypothetical protein
LDTAPPGMNRLSSAHVGRFRNSHSGRRDAQTGNAMVWPLDNPLRISGFSTDFKSGLSLRPRSIGVRKSGSPAGRPCRVAVPGGADRRRSSSGAVVAVHPAIGRDTLAGRRQRGVSGPRATDRRRRPNDETPASRTSFGDAVLADLGVPGLGGVLSSHNMPENSAGSKTTTRDCGTRTPRLEASIRGLQ